MRPTPPASAAPRVSVVVPVYNKGRYLRRAVDSVLAQSFTDFELILVDDGSTDDSLAVAREYTDPRVRVIRQANSGAGAARNRGIDEARATMIAFLDGDDEWVPAFLDQMMALVREYPHAGLYCAPYIYVEPGNVRIVPKLAGVPERGILPSYFRSVAGGGQVATSTSVCVPRAVFDSVGKFPGEQLGEDQDMWARIALEYPVAAMRGRPLALYYRDAQGRAMHTRPPERELPYSVRLQQQVDAGLLTDSVRADVMLYIEAGLLTLASLNARAGEWEKARQFLADPRIRRLWLRRLAWRAVCANGRTAAFAIGVLNRVRWAIARLRPHRG